VLGVPVEFSCNTAAGLAAVDESFGGWRGVGVSAAGEPVRVRVIVHPGDESPGPVSVTWRMPDTRRIIGHTAGSVGIADLERRDVFIYATPTLLADRVHFCHGLLEALTLTTINALDRSPLHAGALVRDGSVLLLTGASGQGKSTLVYTAMRAGMDVLADDAVYIQLRPELRLWGVPSRLYLLPDVRGVFPELGSLEPTVLANGKTKLVIPTDPARRPMLPVRAGRVGAVILRRSTGPVSLARVSAADIRSTLQADLETWFALLGDTMEEVIGRVAGDGGWLLTLSANPLEALPCLSRVFDELDRRDRPAHSD
ncbi:MAG: hypothetical protein HY700_21185, partial [Gemmatimonadetes bacterium]|nr:hypothetical protein [Gemmatimonadota bacterium]